jgi:hypothetical protein
MSRSADGLSEKDMKRLRLVCPKGADEIVRMRAELEAAKAELAEAVVAHSDPALVSPENAATPVVERQAPAIDGACGYCKRGGCDNTCPQSLHPAPDVCDHGCKNTTFCPDSHVRVAERPAGEARDFEDPHDIWCDCEPCCKIRREENEKRFGAQPPGAAQAEVTTELPGVTLDNMAHVPCSYGDEIAKRPSTLQAWVTFEHAAESAAKDIRANLARQAEDFAQERMRERQQMADELVRLDAAAKSQAEAHAREREALRLRCGCAANKPKRN